MFPFFTFSSKYGNIRHCLNVFFQSSYCIKPIILVALLGHNITYTCTKYQLKGCV